MKKVNFNKRNLKYGGVAVAFTAVVVVAVIILNVILFRGIQTLPARRFILYRTLSKKSLTICFPQTKTTIPTMIFI